MSDGPEWFAPKRHGLGSGLPISWQGWAVLLVYLAIVTGGAVLAGEERPLMMFAIIVPATLALLLIAARTTRGGWRWRWGERD